MKALIILSLTIVSLNAFATESKTLGEDKKGNCDQIVSTPKREVKVVVPQGQQTKEIVKEVRSM